MKTESIETETCCTTKESEKHHPIDLNQVKQQQKVARVISDIRKAEDVLGAILENANNVVLDETQGEIKQVALLIFGHGNVGEVLIQQLLDAKDGIQLRKGIDLNIVAISNSKKCLFNVQGIGQNWKSEIKNGVEAGVNQVLQWSKANAIKNGIVIDVTASSELVEHYESFVSNGFDLVSANKIANTKSYAFYENLRNHLKVHQKNYLYETNVGAGLPLIDTIKLLHLSGENITKIKGVFSGSLSFIFNHFSVEDKPFSEVLKKAIANGYTEPDPREDLCGNDVARKLLILARELDLQNEFDEIHIQNLIPESLRKISTEDFLSNLEELNDYYETVKLSQKEGNVLRYVGELSGDLQKDKGNLEVKLISVPESSALGQLKGSDSIFEIYTESYGERPIVIQGAGAGASVTARGVFGDILRLVDKN